MDVIKVAIHNYILYSHTCCNLLKRWISSMKRIVFLLSMALSFLATFTTSFTSATPQVVA